MGLHYRKTTKIGPFRVTATQNGIGWSFGSKYMRVGKSATGKMSVSGGFNGVYYRQQIGSGKNKSNRFQNKHHIVDNNSYSRSPQDNANINLFWIIGFWGLIITPLIALITWSGTVLCWSLGIFSVFCIIGLFISKNKTTNIADENKSQLLTENQEDDYTQIGNKEAKEKKDSIYHTEASELVKKEDFHASNDISEIPTTQQLADSATEIEENSDCIQADGDKCEITDVIESEDNLVNEKHLISLPIDFFNKVSAVKEPLGWGKNNYLLPPIDIIKNCNDSISEVKTYDIYSSPSYLEESMPLILGKSFTGKIEVKSFNEINNLLVIGSSHYDVSQYINSVIFGLLFKIKLFKTSLSIVNPFGIDYKHINAIKYPAFISFFNQDTVLRTTDDINKVLEYILYLQKSRLLLFVDADETDIDSYNAKYLRGELVYKNKIRVLRDYYAFHHLLSNYVFVIDDLQSFFTYLPKESIQLLIDVLSFNCQHQNFGINIIIGCSGVIRSPYFYKINNLISNKVIFNLSEADSKYLLKNKAACELDDYNKAIYVSDVERNKITTSIFTKEEQNCLVNWLKQNNMPSFIDRFFGGPSSEGVDSEWICDSIQREKEEKSSFCPDLSLYIETLFENGVSADSLMAKHQIGYEKAIMIMDQLEYLGIVTPYEQNKTRTLLISNVDEVKRIIKTALR